MLKNRATNTPLFVIVFTLVPAEEVEEAEGDGEGQESKTKGKSGTSEESNGAAKETKEVDRKAGGEARFVDEGVD